MKLLLQILPWFLSFSSIFIAWQIGNKTKWIFKVKLINQMIWLFWAIASCNYGFTPQAFVALFLAFRNDRKWNEN